MPGKSPFSLSVVIMTYNEEANIGRCLESVRGLAEEVFVLDSYSTDGTVEIARSTGARVEQHPFDTYVHQKNRMIEMASNDWILSIDADEYLSDELKKSILRVKTQTDLDGFKSNRRNKIGDKWINHGNWYPDRKIRLFDRRKVRIVGNDPHDVMEPIPGARIGFLKGDLMHLADDSLSSRFQTIERHSTRAAEALFAKGKRWSLLKIIGKPFIRFVVSYFIRLGFLDGYYGLFIARSEAFYVWMREVKLWELCRKAKKLKS
jgi:glycosyltransferase involved in cell wall biosynthesis